MAMDPTLLARTNPGINEQLMTAQQQLALAQALRGQSLEPIQAPGGQNGRISPLSALAKVLSGYTASSKMQGATHDLATAQAAQAQNQMAIMARMLGGGQQPAGANDGTQPLSQTPQASYPGMALPSPTPASAGAPSVPDPTSDPNWQHQALLEDFGIAPSGTAATYAKALMDRAAPTDQIKNDQWSGVSPQQRAGVTSGVNLSPNQSRVQVGADGKPALSMVAPDPANNTQYAVGGGQVSAAPVPGVVPARAALAGADAGARADNGIITVTGPNGEQVPVKGGPAAKVGGQQLGLAPPPTWTGGKLSDADLTKLQTNAGAGDKNSQMVLDAYNRAQPRLGQPTGAKESIEGMSKKWEDLTANNGSSQQAISFLSNIKQLADQAITGTGSDKLAFANGLLAQAGISDRARDAQTATDLLNKNANRITALLGQGSLGTDAARQVLAAANPNAKMSKEAIKEAADDIIGQYRMTQAKANVLLPLRNANDAQGYNTAETKFNQVADPRIWRLQSMPPQDAAAYIKRMAPADAADLLRRRTEVMKNGWLQ